MLTNNQTHCNGLTKLNSEQTEQRASSLELFFDLVFVFTITQLAALVEHHTSFVGLIKAAAIFIAMYWMYGGYVWLTNQVPPTTHSRRLLLLCGMSAFLICALAIPKAFDENALAFSIGYVLVVLVHSGLYAQVHGSAVWRFVPFNLLGAASLVAAAFANEWMKVIFWMVPICLNLITSMLAGRVNESSSSGFKVNAGHFVERHGLLLLIVFGESIIAIGIGLAELKLTLSVYGAAVLGLILIAGLWWSYFNSDEARSEHAMLAAPVAERVRLALHGYFYSYILILLGIVMLSAGLRHAISSTSLALPMDQSELLGSGVALYLLGTVAFKMTFGIRPIVPRLIASIAAIATCFAGVTICAFFQIALLILLIIGCIVVESIKNSNSNQPNAHRS